ncbi:MULTISPECIES: AAA-like domain-containing protein [Okeania]|uniref:TIR domain-containing protein n=1 Tax=Okeania hirsuta TaxID=1458930 RepID=A0A3N6NT93_9CYAN|nr:MULTISPECIES: AAA-like domain-containing protein [Okeania]NEP05538.1 TIR domain-containing protein [Okeania sp. SIO4D6]NEP74782.1 TIR domain-containing protein [Okeania sp. SIO2G5]NEP95858.1 TIR domain-containing protein [Okeania sp. SIO2F5]NEQ93585.1 TIR domain-containing protein [Okeania sp. SIO2G4]NES90265.1 TIR domain-containing protein [Okeania sp. SIO2B9]
MEKKSKRDRGRILTTSGLKKLNEAIEEWKQQYNLRATLAEIEAESGVGSDTISKIRQGRVGADLSKIQQLFASFGLTLDEADHRSGKQSQTSSETEPIGELLPLLNNEEIVSHNSSQVFISYCSQDPDRELARQFETALNAAGHQVFMAADRIRLGENWFRRINEELRRCDYLLLFLPPQSVQSELLTYQVQLARELQFSRPNRKPVILPIRVGFSLSTPLNHDLRGYLYRIQQREWRSPEDSVVILREVLTLLATPPENIASEVEEQQETLPAEEISSIASTNSAPLPSAEPEIPGGQIDVASTFYIERPPIEERCYQAILQPSGLIRIKAPRQMGKTSLMARILHHATQEGYRTVPLSFQLVDKEVFSNLDKFLKWFCAYVGRELRLPNQLDDYWDDIFGSKVNCKDYFEKYLLAQIDNPLVLGLDEIDRVFQYPDIAEDFLGLLRAWHEESKRRVIWKKLRLLVVHSTEVYIPMNINQSPFNVGLPIDLPEFNPQQVRDLASRHNLNWSESEVDKLMTIVGGHPYLVRVALYHISKQDLTLEDLPENVTAETGIYSDHLRRHLWNLEEYPELAEAMKNAISENYNGQLTGMLGFKLDSLGLVKWQSNKCYPRCELYRQYFQAHLLSEK